MRVSYDDGYFVALPDGHPFPMGKFPALHQILLREGLLRNEDVTAPALADWDVLRLVHGQRYLEELAAGGLGRKAERRMGLPWSEALVTRSRLAVGGTVLAARMALEDGIAANLAGGTHHAYPDHGEGFCVLNDVAVAICLLRAEGRLQRALVVDLDVHQGNGTAAVFADDEETFTLSFHGARNYPFEKEASSLDVALDDETRDDDYLAQLQVHLPPVLLQSRPDLIVYLAGVDPLAGDRYGRLSLSRDGLHRRDRMVLRAAHEMGVPLLLVMSGGYAPSPEATAELHAIAHREAADVFGGAL
jgi:acetoin utilization deacetylase AcuC-like enzyme